MHEKCLDNTLNNIINYKNFKLHLEIKGYAMDTTCTPAYGNLFIASFEPKFKCPCTRETVTPLLRVIVDRLVKWTGSEEELQKFINELNKKQKTIKFKFKYSKVKEK